MKAAKKRGTQDELLIQAWVIVGELGVIHNDRKYRNKGICDRKC